MELSAATKSLSRRVWRLALRVVIWTLLLALTVWATAALTIDIGVPWLTTSR